MPYGVVRDSNPEPPALPADRQSKSTYGPSRAGLGVTHSRRHDNVTGSVPLDSMTASRDPREESGRHSTPFTANGVEPCAPTGIRTPNPRLKRTLLYRLSLGAVTCDGHCRPQARANRSARRTSDRGCRMITEDTCEAQYATSPGMPGWSRTTIDGFGDRRSAVDLPAREGAGPWIGVTLPEG